MADDPEDPDLDPFLDDLLDEFEAQKAEKPAEPSKQPALPSVPDGLDDAFLRQLTADMESAFSAANISLPKTSGTDGNPGTMGGDNSGSTKETELMFAALANLMGMTGDAGNGPQPNKEQIDELLAAMGAPLEPTAQPAAGRQADDGNNKQKRDIDEAKKTQPHSGKIPKQSSSKDSSFQDKVAQTMNKLRNSSDTAKQQMSQDEAGMGEEDMEQMINMFSQMMGSEDFASILEPMMDKLVSKELLYEPMKDLGTKYPEWLEKNALKLSAEELERYQQQRVIVDEIVEIYSKSDSKTGTDEENKKVMDLMQKMQLCGMPPEDILEELAPGINGAGGEMPRIPGSSEECCIM